jgi:glycosyltransferase involved in cell wall biosynthesis
MASTKKRICLVSGGHLSSNPRLIKEADALHKHRHEVFAFGVQSLPEITRFDSEFLATKSWTSLNVKVERRGLFSYLIRKLKQSLPVGTEIRGMSSEKFLETFALSHKLHFQRISELRPNLIVAHSLPSLVLAYSIFERMKTPFAFDMEDYHPGESEGGLDHPNNEKAFAILKCCLPYAKYVSAASPQIAEEASRNFGIPFIHSILNSFPTETIPSQAQQDRRGEKVSFYWYSQTIGLDRGLQDFLSICGTLKGSFEVHLRGNISTNIEQDLKDLAKEGGFLNRFHIHSQVAPHHLLQRTAEHDIGLALEAGTTLNRRLCITNKLLFYPMAGLAVAATNTPGQSWVMNQAPKMGFVYEPGDTSTLASKLQEWLDHPRKLQEAKQAARRAAEELFCWEKEEPKFLSLVERALHS